MKEFKFIGFMSFEITAYKWEMENPKACIQLIHGMGEYAARYDEFARVLQENGYSVYASDHRGHGKTLKEHQHPGEIGENGFENMVHDQYLLSKLIKSENPDKKLYILGHSMGSFILQEYLLRYSSHIDKTIISGSCGKMGLELSLGKTLAYLEMKIKKEVNGSKIIDFLNFKMYSLFFKEKHKNAWLNRNKKEVELYNSDPNCGNIFPAHFYYYLYKGIKNLHIPARTQKINKDLEIFIFSGDKDPVGKMGKGVRKLHKMYENVGIKSLHLKLYKDGRHEMLKELNKSEVFEDVLNFIKS